MEDKETPLPQAELYGGKKKISPDNLQQEACPHGEFSIWIYTPSKGNKSPKKVT